MLGSQHSGWASLPATQTADGIERQLDERVVLVDIFSPIREDFLPSTLEARA